MSNNIIDISVDLTGVANNPMMLGKLSETLRKLGIDLDIKPKHELPEIIKIEIPIMNELTQNVRNELKELIEDALKYSHDLDITVILRYKMAANFISSHRDIFPYVNENEKAGKKTFKNVIQNFCDKNNFGSVSLGYTDIIYDENSIKGIIEFYHYTDKTFGFRYTLSQDIVDNFIEVVKTRENINNTPILNRLSMDNRGNMCENNILFNAPKIDIPANIMYPCFTKTPEDYAQEFMDSNANVLVLYGDPGTGKTTFIKRMMLGIGFEDTQRSINVIDTPGVMQSPELINKIYVAKHKDIFIFEDVDRHLYSRESGNDIMAGLLNAAEGIASPDVKIILSTNIQNLEDIDSALLRPGRCHDTLHFTKMNHSQAEVLAHYLNLNMIEGAAELSLAEIMNSKESTVGKSWV